MPGLFTSQLIPFKDYDWNWLEIAWPETGRGTSRWMHLFSFCLQLSFHYNTTIYNTIIKKLILHLASAECENYSLCSEMSQYASITRVFESELCCIDAQSLGGSIATLASRLKSGICSALLLLRNTCISKYFYMCMRANITHHVNVDMGCISNKQNWGNLLGPLRAPPLEWKTECSSFNQSMINSNLVTFKTITVFRPN